MDITRLDVPEMSLRKTVWNHRQHGRLRRSSRELFKSPAGEPDAPMTAEPHLNVQMDEGADRRTEPKGTFFSMCEKNDAQLCFLCVLCLLLVSGWVPSFSLWNLGGRGGGGLALRSCPLFCCLCLFTMSCRVCQNELLASTRV